MPLNPSNPCQEPTCPYASPVGVVEDRSVLMGFLMVPMDPINYILQGPGGSQPKMRDTVYNGGVRQSMVFEDGPLEGEAKGLKVVLEERYGEDYVRGKKKDELGMIII